MPMMHSKSLNFLHSLLGPRMKRFVKEILLMLEIDGIFLLSHDK